MRVAVALHGRDLPRVLRTYDLLSTHAYTHATPTLYNAGTTSQYLASCFLYQPPVEGTLSVMTSCVTDLSKMWAVDGGVGLSLGAVPALECVLFIITSISLADLHSPSATSLPHSSGPVPLLDVLNVHARVHALNRWRRPSSVTAYLPVWHADVHQFTMSFTKRSSIQSGLKHVFPALWVPDVLWVRALYHATSTANVSPSIFPLPVCSASVTVGGGASSTLSMFRSCLKSTVLSSPPPMQHMSLRVWPSATTTSTCCGLQSLTASARREVPSCCSRTTSTVCDLVTAFPLLLIIARCILSPDRNNESHLGIIRLSNLCTEITQFSAPSQPAVCTLASISLPVCVNGDGSFDFDRLQRLVNSVVISTDRCVDVSDYPTEDAAASALRSRALGVGVQGLADTFMMLNLSFTSMGARELNISIFETIYYAALDASCSLAEIHGPYPAWPGSPASRGILQVDMWGVTPSNRHDFPALRARIARFGLRNSVITALMPTASTSKLLGNFESFEPYTR